MSLGSTYFKDKQKTSLNSFINGSSADWKPDVKYSAEVTKQLQRAKTDLEEGILAKY